MNRRLLTLCTALAFSTMTFAQTPSPEPATSGIILPVWPDGKMPGHGADQPEHPNSVPPGGPVKITFVSQPTIEIFKAPGAHGPVPAMIISPGGGYGLLAYKGEGTDIAHWLNTLGITGIVLKYRVPNNRDGAYQDIQRTMRLTRLHAAEWGIQADKLGVIGFSAGGHLSARLSTNFDKAAYPAIDDADKLGCRPDFVVLVYPGYLGDNGTLAPELPVGASTPPTLIVITEDDHHFIGSKVYDAALTAANIPHELQTYPTGGHGYGLHSDKDVKVWPVHAAEWLHKIGVM
ncbi:MAG: alpha/beta hydrolase [Chthoniobacteraceae bacterium]